MKMEVIVLKSTAEESSWQSVVAPRAFHEEGEGWSDWSSGGPVMDMLLGTECCHYGALANGRLAFWLEKKASLVVRDQLGGRGDGEPGKACSLIHSCMALKRSQTLQSMWEQGWELQKSGCLLGETQAPWPPRSLNSLQRAFHAAVWGLLSGMLRSPRNFPWLAVKKGLGVCHLPLFCLICLVRQCLAQW